jgi:protein SCO1/2
MISFQKMLKSIVYISILFLIVSCKQSETQDAEILNATESSSNSEFSDMSIFNLPSAWTNQEGEDIALESLQGKISVMVMIYTSCKAACPRLVADMRNIAKQIPKDKTDQVQYVFVSIDPEVDTPKRLKKFAIENQMDSPEWLFLRGTEEDTREFAAVLAMSYKRISPIDFSHSNIISVFNRKGELIHQREGLSVDSKETVAAIQNLLR